MEIFKYRLPILFVVFLISIISPQTDAQLVKNGGFENSTVGVVDSNGIEGWLIQVAAEASPAPVFEIINDTIKEGTKALRVTVQGLGSNQWDIQLVADSIPAEQGVSYNYSIWAKAEKPGAQVNFTVGNYSYSEYSVIRPANLTTTWKKYTMQYTVHDEQAFVRAPIHFNYAADTNNAIYVDNLQIVSQNFGKKPIVVEAESGETGSGFSTAQSGDITYVTTNSTYTGLTSPDDTSRIITYQVTFQDSGNYNLFARIRVGADTYNDDSFFAGSGFGIKDDTARTDWIMVNGLANAGFTDSAEYVNTMGTSPSEVWKWVNVTKNFFPTDSTTFPFSVSLDSLTKSFQIGSREDGLYFDKLAFGKANLYYTVNALDNELPGAASMTEDSTYFYEGPPLAEGSPKFLGSVRGVGDEDYFTNYWNQITPGNEGKWGSIAYEIDTTKWNWSGLDGLYNYAKDNDLIFKDHTLIWGAQQPGWISALDSAQKHFYIETWIRQVGERYPDIDFIDVVNEALPNHNPPDGNNERANYLDALGGAGTTGWDWVIEAFRMARKYLPDTKLLINDYGIINDNNATTSYLNIINLLKARDLIDGIGVQGHRFEFESADVNVLKTNLTRLGATGLPVYISEMDLGNIDNSGTPDDETQLNLYKRIFPTLWQHPAVQGITFWGYLEDQMWQETCYLVLKNGKSRPAFDWLVQYVNDNPVGVESPDNSIPEKFALDQNYPNPFNPTTTITYQVPFSGKISLKVYNILGQEVASLFEGIREAGHYKVTFDASSLSTGVYLYRLSSDKFSQTKKLMLIK